jgi:hypothetical protein
MWPFTMGHLPYVGSVTVHVCVSLIELLLWTVMGRVPALKYMLFGRVWASMVMPYRRQVMSAPVLEAAVLTMLTGE